MKYIAALLFPALAVTATANPFMGIYQGTFHPDEENTIEARAYVIPEGDDVYYRIVLRTEGENSPQDEAPLEVHGHRNGEEVIIGDRAGGYGWNGGIQSGQLRIQSAYGQYYELEKQTVKSPNEGLEAPENAVVLLPYEPGEKPDMSAWTNQEWEALENGAMQVKNGANRTRQSFGDIRQLHLEFKLPLEPNNRGQGRANSGLFLADTYEVQILDSFGIMPHTSGDCGGLYHIARAVTNANLPPMTWQTYDIAFRAARIADDGSVESAPRITVFLNGVLIHDFQEIPHPTSNPNSDHKARGPLQLQDHGHPIQFRNIWLVEGTP